MADRTVHMLPEEEKTTCSKVLVVLKKRFCSVDIEELWVPECYQFMQDKQSVEVLGIELQKLRCKAFPTSGVKEFDRIVKGRFTKPTDRALQQKCKMTSFSGFKAEDLLT